MMVKNVCLLCKKYIADKEKVLQGEDFLTSLTLKRLGSLKVVYSYILTQSFIFQEELI